MTNDILNLPGVKSQLEMLMSDPSNYEHIDLELAPYAHLYFAKDSYLLYVEFDGKVYTFSDEIQPKIDKDKWRVQRWTKQEAKFLGYLMVKSISNISSKGLNYSALRLLVLDTPRNLIMNRDIQKNDILTLSVVAHNIKSKFHHTDPDTIIKNIWDFGYRFNPSYIKSD